MPCLEPRVKRAANKRGCQFKRNAGRQIFLQHIARPSKSSKQDYISFFSLADQNGGNGVLLCSERRLDSFSISLALSDASYFASEAFPLDWKLPTCSLLASVSFVNDGPSWTGLEVSGLCMFFI
mmetsp:Transcript_4258/g.15099  ORF Transcript_4258/g.15099 Transcript_4258/m.15099 type:complete len:124 (-) Transcript_4258:279-650(-)